MPGQPPPIPPSVMPASPSNNSQGTGTDAPPPAYGQVVGSNAPSSPSASAQSPSNNGRGGKALWQRQMERNQVELQQVSSSSPPPPHSPSANSGAASDAPVFSVKPAAPLAITLSRFHAYKLDTLQVLYFPTLHESASQQTRDQAPICSLPVVNMHCETNIYLTQAKTKVYASFLNTHAHVEGALFIPNSYGKILHSTVRIFNVKFFGPPSQRQFTMSTPTNGSVKLYESHLVTAEELEKLEEEEKKKQQQQQAPQDQSMDPQATKQIGIASYLSSHSHSSHTSNTTHILLPDIPASTLVLVEIDFLADVKYDTRKRQYDFVLPTNYLDTMIGETNSPNQQGGGRNLANDYRSIFSYSLNLHVPNLTHEEIVTPFSAQSSTHQINVRLLSSPQQELSKRPYGSGTYQTYAIDVMNEGVILPAGIDATTQVSSGFSLGYTLPLTNKLQSIVLREIDIPEWDFTANKQKHPGIERGTFMVHLIPPAIEACFGQGGMQPASPSNSGPSSPSSGPVSPRDISLGGISNNNSAFSSSVPPSGTAFQPCILPRLCVFVIDASCPTNSNGMDSVLLRGITGSLSCLSERNGDYFQLFLFNTAGTTTNNGNAKQLSFKPLLASEANKNIFRQFLASRGSVGGSAPNQTLMNTLTSCQNAIASAFNTVAEMTCDRKMSHLQPLMYFAMRGEDSSTNATSTATTNKLASSEPEKNELQLFQSLLEIIPSSFPSPCEMRDHTPRLRVLTCSIGCSAEVKERLQHISLISGGGDTVHTDDTQTKQMLRTGAAATIAGYDSGIALEQAILHQFELHGGLTSREGVVHTAPCLHHITLEAKLEGQDSLPIDMSQQLMSLDEKMDQNTINFFPKDYVIPDLSYGQALTIVGEYTLDSRFRGPIFFPRYFRLKGTLPNAVPYDTRLEVLQDFTVPTSKLCGVKLVETRLAMMAAKYGVKKRGAQQQTQNTTNPGTRTQKELAEEYDRSLLISCSLRFCVSTPLTPRIMTEVSTTAMGPDHDAQYKARKMYEYYEKQRKEMYQVYAKQQQQYQQQQEQERLSNKMQVQMVSQPQPSQPQIVYIIPAAPPQPVIYIQHNNNNNNNNPDHTKYYRTQTYGTSTSSPYYYNSNSGNVSSGVYYNTTDLMLDMLWLSQPRYGYSSGGYGYNSGYHHRPHHYGYTRSYYGGSGWGNGTGAVNINFDADQCCDTCCDNCCDRCCCCCCRLWCDADCTSCLFALNNGQFCWGCGEVCKCLIGDGSICCHIGHCLCQIVNPECIGQCCVHILIVGTAERLHRWTMSMQMSNFNLSLTTASLSTPAGAAQSLYQSTKFSSLHSFFERLLTRVMRATHTEIHLIS